MKIRSAYAAKLSPANLNSLTHFPLFWHAFRRVPLACIMRSSHFPRSHPSVSPLRNDGKTSHYSSTHFVKLQFTPFRRVPFPSQSIQDGIAIKLFISVNTNNFSLPTLLARISQGSPCLHNALVSLSTLASQRFSSP